MLTNTRTEKFYGQAYRKVGLYSRRQLTEAVQRLESAIEFEAAGLGSIAENDFSRALFAERQALGTE